MATNGHTFIGLCDGFDLGPPDAKRRVVLRRVVDGSWDLSAGLVELAKRWETRRERVRDMMGLSKDYCLVRTSGSEARGDR